MLLTVAVGEGEKAFQDHCPDAACTPRVFEFSCLAGPIVSIQEVSMKNHLSVFISIVVVLSAGGVADNRKCGMPPSF